MNKITICFALGTSALFATAAAAAPLIVNRSIVPDSDVQNVRMVCDEYGRCWRQRGERRVVIRDAYGYHVVATYEQRTDGLVLRASAAPPNVRPLARATGSAAPERALSDQQPSLMRVGDPDWFAIQRGMRLQAADGGPALGSPHRH